MVARIEFSLDGSDRLKRVLDRAPRRIFEELRKAFFEDGAEWDRAMQLRTSGAGVRRRTGRTARSIQWVVVGESLDQLELRAFMSGVPNAALLEFGGIVRPKRGRYLTIPIDDNLRPGSLTVREHSARRLKEKDPKNVFFLRLKSGGLYMVQRDGDDLKFMFRLVRQTNHPGPKGPTRAPRPGGSYLGFFYEWRTREKGRKKRRGEAIARALSTRGGA